MKFVTVSQEWIRYFFTPGSNDPIDPPNGNEIELAAIDDAYIQNTSTLNNNLLRVESAGGRTRTSYVKFNVPDTPDKSITSATLRLTVSSDAGNNMRIRLYEGGSDNWNEGNLAPVNAPSKGVLLDDITGNFVIGQEYQFDVSAAVVAGQEVTFVIDSDASISGGDAAFASSENGNNAIRPKLILDLEDLVPQGLSVELSGVVQDVGLGTSYSDQDLSGGVIYSSDGSSATLTGNAWKRYELGYTLTTDTLLEFDLNVIDSGEIILIGFDNDNDHENGVSAFQLDGTQTWLPANQTQTNGSGSYLIRVGDLFTGTATHLLMVADDDLDSSANVVFSNLKIYEIGDIPPTTPTDITISNPSINENLDTSQNNRWFTDLGAVDVNLNESHVYSLVSGEGDSDNTKFFINGNSLYVRQNEALDYEVKPSYAVRIRVTDSSGLAFEKSFDLSVNNLVEVAEGDITVGDGTTQRSRVNSISVQFDSEVNIEEDAFSIKKRDENDTVDHTITQSIDASGNTIATLTFSGDYTHGGSLIDGNYELLIDGLKINGTNGHGFDHNKDGVVGDQMIFGDNALDHFYRMIGDSNGDRSIDYADVFAAIGS
ncbi:MAG: hypothetical protein AAF664_17480, partial [Planctomycetota bacterium]